MLRMMSPWEVQTQFPGGEDRAMLESNLSAPPGPLGPAPGLSALCPPVSLGGEGGKLRGRYCGPVPPASLTARETELRLRDGTTEALPTADGWRCGVHWWRCVLPDTHGVRNWLRHYLGEFVERESGHLKWYARSWLALDGHAVIATEHNNEHGLPREERTLLLDVTGSGCDLLGERLPALMRKCFELGGQASRVDFYLDDTAGLLTRERLEAALEAGLVVTRWRKAQSRVLYGFGKDGQSSTTGYIVMFGSRASDSYVRVYDKRAERLSKGEQVAVKHWYRLELEAKSELAHELALAWLARGSVAVVEQVNRRLRFVAENGSDSNRWRWPMAGWWRRFVCVVQRGASLIQRELPMPSLAAGVAWLRRCAAPWLSTLMQARGGDLAVLLSLVASGDARLKSKHRMALVAAGV